MRRAYALSEEEFCRAEAELELAVLLVLMTVLLCAMDVMELLLIKMRRLKKQRPAQLLLLI